MNSPSDYEEEEEDYGCLIPVLAIVAVYTLIAIVLAMM